MRVKITERLKSPVVIGQIIAAIAAVWTAVTGEDVSKVVAIVVAVVTNVYALFAALNNPTTPDKL